MEENGSYSWVPPQPPKEKKKPDFKRFGKTAVVFILFALLVMGAMTCFYTVDDKQQLDQGKNVLFFHGSHLFRLFYMEQYIRKKTESQ